MPDNSKKKIAIIGAGPTGLAAAYRLKELGHTDFRLYESEENVGGLSSTEADDKGFLWDLGPHVLFSHYPYIDQLIEKAVPKWLDLPRASWIWIEGRLVPYPLQSHIRHLSKETCWKAIKGLLAVHNRQPMHAPANFREWIYATFGEGLAEIFMIPYNRKIWACPAEMMDWRWIGERVTVVNLESTLHKVWFEEDEPGWGPNQRFRFPAAGAAGALHEGIANLVGREHIAFGRKAVKIDPKGKKIYFADGGQEGYDILISTIPLTYLMDMTGIESVKKHRDKFLHSTTHVVGLGIEGKPPSERISGASWIYFPEKEYPFYRVTVFSSYASYAVPDAKKNWSMLVEFAESKHTPLDTKTLTKQAVEGLTQAKILSAGDKVVSTWYRKAEHGYPVAFVNRDAVLKEVQDALAAHDIYSRGRFGGWKYEVSNQDHSLMQGVELASTLIEGTPETVYWPKP